ncbi:MAG: type II toxin-antitoxin system VapC family toxin [Hyphomicrobiales bacterium]|nr:type II toxin-antitoxin system VapC family toxin [Hyphomicrobiales bacterium]
MAFLLDTNVISAARRADRQEHGFQAFLRTFEAVQAFVSSVSIREIRFGIQREQNRDPEFAAELMRWLDKVVLAQFAGRILPFDRTLALRAGASRTADRRPSAHAMIAATALEHGLRVVTRNVAHFEPLGVVCIDPWRFDETR